LAMKKMSRNLARTVRAVARARLLADKTRFQNGR
jgi:hypothetical protein